MSDIVVIYHKNCADGFGAAWAAWGEFGDDAVYIPHQYGDPPIPEDVYRDKDVYLVDYSFKKEYLYDFARLARHVTIIDHHKTAEADLSDLTPSAFPNVTVHFDMSKSGAMLSFEHFQGYAGRPPRLIEYIQDRDLWNWKLLSSKEVSAVVSLTDFTFEAYEDLADALEHNFSGVISQGSTILKYQDKLVKQISKNVRTKAFVHGYDGEHDPIIGQVVGIVNSPVLQSEVGNQILIDNPDIHVAAVYCDKLDVRTWSLRARKGGIDVSNLCKVHGGGGHQAAAGMTTDIGRDFPEIFYYPRT